MFVFFVVVTVVVIGQQLRLAKTKVPIFGIDLADATVDTCQATEVVVIARFDKYNRAKAPLAVAGLVILSSILPLAGIFG